VLIARTICVEFAAMRICLISDELGGGSAGPSAALAELLGYEHEVTLLGPADVEPGEELRSMVFANEEHRRSAAVLAAIETAYGDQGPDYLEARDRDAPALMALMARRGGHRSLRDTRVGVRLIGTTELTALQNAALSERGIEAICDLEREQLRLADRLISPGGDSAALYRRYYEMELAPAVRIGLPLALPDGVAVEGESDRGAPLRILCLGDLTRGMGAGDLAEACLRLAREDWELTFSGPDSETTTFRQSMRDTIEEVFRGDPRVRFEHTPVIGEHDLLVAAARFDVWPVQALEAMAAGLPVLATPVGGLTEIVEDGVSGWFVDGTGPDPLRAGIERLLEDRSLVRAARESGAPRRRALMLSDPERILDGYRAMFAKLEPRRSSVGVPAPEPLVTAIVPYYRAAEHVEEAIDSFFAQTHPRVEAMIVNDGSFEEDDEVLLRLAERPGVRVVTQLNGGEATARNVGVKLAEGEFLVMLDADNVLEPEFLERALEALRSEPELAYVSCWLRFIGPDGSPYEGSVGCAHIGNRVMRDDSVNWDGDTLALIPRQLLSDLGFFHEPQAATHTDWEFYRCLRDLGRFGMVVPEMLARYRVRPESLMRTWGDDTVERGWRESHDRRIERRVEWEGVPGDGS
jgi:glycogen synthase